MFLNHVRMNVYTWDKIEPSAQPSSHCPECNEELVARPGCMAYLALGTQTRYWQSACLLDRGN